MTLAVDPDILEIPFRTLGAAFTEFADRHPDKIAIHSIDQTASLTFRDLRRLTDRAAARMISDGVIPAATALPRGAAWRPGTESNLATMMPITM